MENKKAQRDIFLTTSVLAVVLLSGIYFSMVSAETPVYNSSTPGPIYTNPAPVVYGPQEATGTGSFPGGSPTSAANSGLGTMPAGSSTSAAANGVYLPSSSDIGLSDRGIKDILTSVLKWLLSIVGVLALIGFVISGIQYILAAGDEKLMETGKKNMMYSIIGIVIVMASLVVVQAIDYALRGYSAF